MSIFDTFSTGVRAYVRTGRHGPSAIKWDPPFESALYIQKDAKGRVCAVSLQDVSDFAEFDPRYHHEAETLLSCEDYALEILELPSRQVSLPL